MNSSNQITFKMKGKVNIGQYVRVVGDMEELGKWNPNNGVDLIIENV